MGERPLDVSALEAPEPLQRAIKALQGLPHGDYLRMCHRIQPLHLYPWLERQGFASETRQGEEGCCELFIWHRDDDDAAQAAQAVAATLPPWRE